MWGHTMANRQVIAVETAEAEAAANSHYMAAMGSPFSPIVPNLFMEDFKK